jgi:hypothetical protein
VTIYPVAGQAAVAPVSDGLLIAAPLSRLELTLDAWSDSTATSLTNAALLRDVLLLPATPVWGATTLTTATRTLLAQKGGAFLGQVSDFTAAATLSPGAHVDVDLTVSSDTSPDAYGVLISFLKGFASQPSVPGFETLLMPYHFAAQPRSDGWHGTLDLTVENIQYLAGLMNQAMLAQGGTP